MVKSISNQTSQWCTLSAQHVLMAWIERSECCHSEKHRRPSNKGSYGAWYRPLLRRWWFWCEWEQNSPNWDRNAIRRGKIGVGGQRATFTQYWFCSLSLKERELVTEADEWCPFVLHSTCLFWQWRQHKAFFFPPFFFNLWSFVSGTHAHCPQFGQKGLQHGYVEGQYMTLIKEFGLFSSNRASKHTKNQNPRKGFWISPMSFTPELISTKYWPSGSEKGACVEMNTEDRHLGWESVPHSHQLCQQLVKLSNPTPKEHFWLTDAVEGA